MLQTQCKHSSSLPFGTCAFCNLTAPDKLADICYKYISEHVEAFCDTKYGEISLKKGVSLQLEICEQLLTIRSNSLLGVASDFVNIFSDTRNTRLKRVKLKKSAIDNSNLKKLLEHQLTELEILNDKTLNYHCLQCISEHGASLQSLTIGENTNIIRSVVDSSLNEENSRGYIIDTPNLRRLTLHGCYVQHHDFFKLLLKPLNLLTHLDLSGARRDLGKFDYAEHLTNLRCLILYNVKSIDLMIPSICKLKNIQHLDISQSKEKHRDFLEPTKILAKLVDNLPRLESLDISGTNLAGTGVAEEDSVRGSDIRGLINRVDNPLQFLGLYDTSHEACLRHDIPAKLIAGNANEEQILIAGLAYLDRIYMLQKVMNELFHLFRFEMCQFVGQALNVVLEAMNRHVNERHIQISGSATLFYIVKSTGTELHDSANVKRHIITTLLNGMSIHKDDDTMMRNGCLTLCQFKIPADVLFEYERLVEILLHSVQIWSSETFVQRIGIYLLNSLACQVDGHQKVRLGELGAISKMICLISERLQRELCDDVLEVAWSTMWNVTDETPSNCKKFLENDGMKYFLSCLKKFPDKEELLRNMMGLLGNVAEVRVLRPYLITQEYLTVFSDLLESRSDGIEVSYNAAGVISHIASDGPDVWTVEKPSRAEVLNKMVAAIDRWDLDSPRNINYRSFEPILYLVGIYHTPECQRWAVWALANLTTMYPDKYCTLVEKEGGITLLTDLINHPDPPVAVKQLAKTVIRNCGNYKMQEGWEQELDG